MRKHVVPVDPAASIPDPDRGGFLPPKGRAVSWTPHWAGLAARQEITAADLPDEPEAAHPVPPAEGEPAADPNEAHPDA